MNDIIVLTKNYQYWKEVDLKKAFSWLAKEKIEVVLASETKKVGSISFKMPKPLVIRLVDFAGFKTKSDTPKYSDHGVYMRDNNICQYYHFNKKKQKFKYHCKNSERTIDHVTPQSQGGKYTFENCVCCCIYHNQQKADKTPEQANLILIRKPITPKYKKQESGFLKVKFKHDQNKESHNAYVELFLMKKE
jgi:hypothetical protein